MASLSHSTNHLWLVDSKGKVSVAHESGAAAEASSINETLLGVPPAVDMEWEPVEGRLDRVACGYSGLVCGTQGSILYIRRGVTLDNPLGTSWAKCFCDVADISVGNETVVRRTSSGEFFTCKVDERLLSPPVFLPSWRLVPRCTLEEEEGSIQHFVLDARDNLYVLASTGVVYRYDDVRRFEEDESRWREISKLPLTESKGGFSLFNFWRGWAGSGGVEKEGMLSAFCAGSHISSSSQALWCLRGEDAWQLILSDFVRSDGETELKTNWVKLSLPKGDKIAAICSDKTRNDALYAIVDEGKALLAFNLLQPDGGRMVLPNPQRFRRSQRWKSVAVCRTLRELAVQPSVSFSSSPNPPQVSSLYPKLPLASNPHSSWLTAEEGEQHAHKRKYSEPLELREHDFEALKRPRLASSEELGAVEHQGSASLIRRRPLGSLAEEEEHFHTSFSEPVKRPKLVEHPNMARFFLLDGVKLKLKDFKPTRLYKYTRPYQIQLPISPVEVDEQFNYSFDLERKVLREATHMKEEFTTPEL